MRGSAARILLAVSTALALVAPIGSRALDPARAVTQYGLQAWTTAQGLPSNAVNVALHSRTGYLWLGTEDGLVRFDGLQFILFDRRTTPAFSVNDVTGLVETPAGTLWAATNGGGLVRYEDGVFSHVGKGEGLPDGRVWAICGDGGEGVWVGTPSSGLYRIGGDPCRAVAVEFPGSRDGISALHLAAPGTFGMGPEGVGGVWVASATKLYLYAGGSFAPQVLPRRFSGALITSILSDRRGRLWVGTDRGVVRLERGGRSVFTIREGLLSDRIFFLSGDRDGNTWVGTYGGGLARVTPDDRVAILGTSHGLADDRPLCFCEDGDGSAWVGTRGGGLNRLTDGPVTPFTTVEGLTSDRVCSVFQDRDGSLWFGTAGGGLNRLKAGRVSAWGVREGLSSDTVRALYRDRAGILWAGTSDGCLNRFDGRRFVSEAFQAGPHAYAVSSITQDGKGRLWVGTRGGGLWSGVGGHLERVAPADEPSAWGVYALLPDADGTMWMGTSEGLYHRVGDRFIHCLQEPDLNREKIFGMCRDGSGTLWLATYAGGLVRYAEGRARRIRGADGLGADTFYDVVADGKGRLWLTGNKGIVAVDLRDLDAFARGRTTSVPVRTLGLEAGLRTLECNGGDQPAGWLASDGRLWFPTARGAVEVDPARMSALETPPVARIETVLVNGRRLPPRSAAMIPRGAGTLEFQFSVPEFQNPGRLQVLYRLDGVDSDWVAAGTRRTAHYGNVPSGAVVFRVKGGDGQTFGREAVASFKLQPPWAQHPLVLAALATLVAGLVFTAYRLRVGLLERRERLLEEMVAQRTAELTVEKDLVTGLEERYRAVVEGQTEMICRFTPDGTLLFVNRTLARMWGREPDALLGENLFTFLPQRVHGAAREALAGCTPTEPVRLTEQRFRTPQGEKRVHQWSVRAFFDPGGAVTSFQGVGRDVTELRRLGEQLVQAQKMEAIGLLAGGVAHDFNNLLQAMLSASGTLHRVCTPCEQGVKVVREIEQDIQRAAQLTRQLLLFARQETARPEALDLGVVVLGLEGLLKRLLRENITLQLALSEEPLPICADLSQMEQAIVNLVVNASDAMPSGGRLVLATGSEGGDRAWLAVRDSGPGVPDGLRQRIFEPFFTTKEPDRGTGLGLPVVLGIVQQNRGAIEVGVAPEGGACLKVTLPLVRAPLPTAEGARSAPAPVQGRSGRRVLLVEDAEGVRDWLGEALSMLGYLVTTAGTLREALWELARNPFDLVLSDVLLPDGSGGELAHHLGTLDSPPALILMSGYARDEVLRREVTAGTVRFLQKPFGLEALEREMRLALTEEGRPVAETAPS